ncbi:MAG: hypothetical protein QF535_03070 [Anaerolineales bacterium]|nr:hypothetical protein [Anaerolineales bacterium]
MGNRDDVEFLFCDVLCNSEGRSPIGPVTVAVMKYRGGHRKGRLLICDLDGLEDRAMAKEMRGEPNEETVKAIEQVMHM